MSYVARRASIDVVAKNVTHDFRFRLDDHASPRIAGHRLVTVCESAGIEALADASRLSPSHLVRIILAVELTDQAAKTDQNGVDYALMHCANFDTQERQALVDAGEVFHIAREAVQRFHNDHFKSALARLVHEGKQTVAAED